MYTELDWTIRLYNDRSAKHEIDIVVFGSEAINKSKSVRLSLPFKPFKQIDNVKTEHQGQDFPWEVDFTAKGESKTYSFNLSEFISSNIENKDIKFRVTFDEHNAISIYNKLHVASFYYQCRGLFAHSIKVSIHLPLINRFSYFIYWLHIINNKLFKKKKERGIYKIYEGEGGQVQKWESVEGGRDVVITYRNQSNNVEFPLVNFLFQKIQSSYIWNIICFFAGIIFAITINLISNTKKVQNIFDSFVNLFFGS